MLAATGRLLLVIGGLRCGDRNPHQALANGWPNRPLCDPAEPP
jgi:hypothetical protein